MLRDAALAVARHGNGFGMLGKVSEALNACGLYNPDRCDFLCGYGELSFADCRQADYVAQALLKLREDHDNETFRRELEKILRPLDLSIPETHQKITYAVAIAIRKLRETAPDLTVGDICAIVHELQDAEVSASEMLEPILTQLAMRFESNLEIPEDHVTVHAKSGVVTRTRTTSPCVRRKNHNYKPDYKRGRERMKLYNSMDKKAIKCPPGTHHSKQCFLQFPLYPCLSHDRDAEGQFMCHPSAGAAEAEDFGLLLPIPVPCKYEGLPSVGLCPDTTYLCAHRIPCETNEATGEATCTTPITALDMGQRRRKITSKHSKALSLPAAVGKDALWICSRPLGPMLAADGSAVFSLAPCEVTSSCPDPGAKKAAESSDSDSDEYFDAIDDSDIAEEAISVPVKSLFAKRQDSIIAARARWPKSALKKAGGPKKGGIRFAEKVDEVERQ